MDLKALICEMCYSNDVMKKGDHFVCACCGTKYSDEDTKRLLLDAAINVSGMLKIDHSSEAEKYLKIARIARKKEDWQDTEKYYSLVMLHDPTNPEAIFYSSYGKARVALWDDNFLRRKSIFNALGKTISLLAKYVDLSHKQFLQGVGKDMEALCTSEFADANAKTKDGKHTNGADATRELFAKVNMAFIEQLVLIAKEANEKDRLYLRELVAMHYDRQAELTTDNEKRVSYIQKSYKHLCTLKRIDPRYDTSAIQAQIQRLRKILWKEKIWPMIKGWYPLVLIILIMIVVSMLCLLNPQ